MKLSVIIHSSNTATVTRIPSLWERWLLGREQVTVGVMRIRLLGYAPDNTPLYGWVYADNRGVDRKTAQAIERALTMHAVRERHERLVRR
jgi:hypothetical protein